MRFVYYNRVYQKRWLDYMARYCKTVKLIILYLVSPASYVTSKVKLDDEHLMLFRMTINICYYAAIISVYFIITNI